MPIVLKDYTWTQTAKTVHIRIPISQVSHDKVDIFPTDSYIKAYFNPFIFEVFLLHDVDISKSKSVVKEDIIIFDLIKREEQNWETLEKELTKTDKMQLKQIILEKCQEEAQKAAEDKRIKKSNLDRFAVQRAMDIDSKQHELMDARRDAQRNKAMEDLEKWRVESDEKEFRTFNNLGVAKLTPKIVELTTTEDGLGKQNFSNKPEANKNQEAKIEELPTSEDETENKINKQLVPKSESKEEGKTEATIRRPENVPVRSEYIKKKKEEITKRVLPRLREIGQLEITHTPRTFPTPSRESTAQEEEAWLRNITLARRATGFVSEDLRPEEQDPQWCKDKGDEFFKCGNFLGAISAYTHGITLSDKLPTLYANRAATHFALGNFNKCVNDCSSALDLMKPACEGNRRSRAKCIARRAAGLARMGYLNKAIGEMKAAGKLLPDDEAIQRDIYDMERAWEQNPDSD